MFPENRFTNWYNNLHSNIKLAFYSTFILGLICHIYMLTNKWVNLDDIVQLVDKMDRTTSGRWFLQFPSAIGSDFSLPWLNGFLTILYTAVMSCFVVKMFNISSKINTIIISGVLVTFPTLGAVMPFMNTQDSYQFGAMLAGIAAYLLVKHRNGFIYSAILLTLSLGIYQTYLGYAAGLIFIYILIELLKDKDNLKEMIELFIKTGLSFLASVSLYIIISRGIFGHLLVDYKGLSSMGSLPLNQLPSIILNTYVEMFKFFSGLEFNYHFTFMRYLYAISFLLTFYLIYFIIKKVKINTNKILAICFIILIMPIAINVIYIMSWEAGVMLRMAYAYTTALIFPLLLIDYFVRNYKVIMSNKIFDEVSVIEKNIIENTQFEDTQTEVSYIENPQIEYSEKGNSQTEDSVINTNKLNDKKRIKEKQSIKFAYFATWFLTITIGLSVYNNIYVTNKAYFKVGVTNQNSHAYGNRIVTRLEMHPDYTEKVKIAFLGRPDSRTRFTKNYDADDIKPFVIANHLTRLYSFKYYPVRFLGFPNSITDYEEIEPKIEHLKSEIESMPLYPAEGSIRLLDDVLYIKFKEIK